MLVGIVLWRDIRHIFLDRILADILLSLRESAGGDHQNLTQMSKGGESNAHFGESPFVDFVPGFLTLCLLRLSTFWIVLKSGAPPLHNLLPQDLP